jgi:hypothetical protein
MKEWKKQQMNWQVSFPLWIFKVKICHIEETMQLVGEEIVDTKYNMSTLVDLAWGREIYLGLDLNDQPTPLTKLPHALQWSIFGAFNYRCHEHAIFMDKFEDDVNF